ncbi:GRF-type domain-containing protein [Abeliophyllum distichum]|uniref:GRF-type domain-containing protein n=1 Tax=Abeliophyllum distichum TaxID=126358 RepID=A0ABD1REJ1_9LAMI
MENSLITSQMLDALVCYCGQISVTRTSWTENNPSRRFQGCRFYGRSDSCDYFSWVDPPPHPRYKLVINGLLRKANNNRNGEMKMQRLVKLHQIVLGVFVLGFSDSQICNLKWCGSM